MTATATAEPSLEALLDKWAGWLTGLADRHARRLGLDRDDVLSEIRCAIVAQFGAFDSGRAGFSTWSRLVARSVAGVLRDRGRRSPVCFHTYDYPRNRGPGDQLVSAVEFAPDPAAADPLDTAEAGERTAAVAAALAELTPAQRAAVRAKFWGEAGALGPGGERHLYEALAVLRERLGPDGTDDG